MARYYFLSFATGAGLLAFEVFGPRLLQPHLGQSPILWASTISVFLGGLTCGYFLGGKFSSKKNILSLISWIWGLIAVFVFFSPEISNIIASMFLNEAPTKWEPLYISFLNFFIPATLMGTSLPIIVHLCPSIGKTKGEHAGVLLAISTMGSILGVLGLYFGLITYFTVSEIAMYLALPWVISIIFLLSKKRKTDGKNKIKTAAVFFLFFNYPNTGNYQTIQYQKNSLLHQITVIDEGQNRYLLFDDYIQSTMKKNAPLEGHFDYIEAFHLVNILQGRQGVTCMVGLGGGSAIRTFIDRYQDGKVIVAEIDPVVEAVANEYFGIPESENLEINIIDGRQMFKRKGAPECDTALIDGYSTSRYGAYIPWHLTTKEFFFEIKETMPEDGIIAYNVIGTIDGKSSTNVKMIAKTILEHFDHVIAVPIVETFNVVLFGFNGNIDDYSGKLQEFRLEKNQKYQNLLRLSYLVKAIPISKKIPVLSDEWAPMDMPGLMVKIYQ